MDKPRYWKDVHGEVLSSLAKNGSALFKALILPVIVIIVCEFVASLKGLSFLIRVPVIALYLFALSVFAVAVHRKMLEGSVGESSWGGFVRPTRRDFVYMGYLLLLFFFPAALLVIVASFADRLTEKGAVLAAMIGFMVVFLYVVFARLSYLLPATAINERIGPVTAWRRSAGHAGLILGASMMYPFLLNVVARGLKQWLESPLLDSAVTILGTLFSVTALSLAYRLINSYAQGVDASGFPDEGSEGASNES